jgi:alkylation response protein AidB-like acyl-CoA dehydrogenase
MAFSEPEGSANFDADGPGQGVRTTAVLDGNEWVINGRKAWASHLCGWDGDGPDIMTIGCCTPGGISLVVAERAHLARKIEVEEYYDLPGLKGCLSTRVMLRDVRVPRGNLLGAQGQGVELTPNAFFPSGASIGVFAVAAMRQVFDIAYRFALTQTRVSAGGL